MSNTQKTLFERFHHEKVFVDRNNNYEPNLKSGLLLIKVHLQMYIQFMRKRTEMP